MKKLTLTAMIFLGSFLTSCYSTIIKEGDAGYNYYRALTATSPTDAKELLNNASDSQREDIFSNLHNPYGMGILAITLKEDRQDLLPLLLDTYHVDVNQKGLGDVTALHVAVRQKMLSILTDLLDKYHATPTLTAMGKNLLHEATWVPQNPCIPLLIKRFPEMLSQKDKDGNVPLFYAARNRDLPTLRLLAKVETKADVNAVNKEGYSPLSYSVEMHHEDVANILRKIR